MFGGIVSRNIHLCDQFPGIEILLKYKSEAGKTLKDLKAFTAENENFKADISKLAAKVEELSSRFDIPGNDII